MPKRMPPFRYRHSTSVVASGSLAVLTRRHEGHEGHEGLLAAASLLSFRVGRVHRSRFLGWGPQKSLRGAPLRSEMRGGVPVQGVLRGLRVLRAFVSNRQRSRHDHGARAQCPRDSHPLTATSQTAANHPIAPRSRRDRLVTGASPSAVVQNFPYTTAAAPRHDRAGNALCRSGVARPR